MIFLKTVKKLICLDIATVLLDIILLRTTNTRSFVTDSTHKRRISRGGLVEQRLVMQKDN